MSLMHSQRRLHQMMFADRDYERNPILKLICGDTIVTVHNWEEMGLFSCECSVQGFNQTNI